jgi:hypothetical protein
MSRFRLLLLGLLATLAVGAVSAASASAEGCSDGGTKNLFCAFPGNVEIHELSVTGEGGLSVLALTIAGTETKLHCKDNRFAGTLHLLGVAIGEVDFLGCTVEKPAGCSVQGDPGHPGLVLASIHIQLLSDLMGSGLLGLATGNSTGGEAEEFTKLEITGSCVLKGSWIVTGLQILELPEGETGKVEHEIVAKKANSKLKFGGNVASFSSTAKVHLDSNESWLIMLGT